MSIATLGYVPYLRPGAMLFTLLVFRYRQSGSRGICKVLEDLYGRVGGRKRNLMGEHVATVVTRAFGDAASPKDVLLNHTFFGVYSRAMAPPVAVALSNALIIGNQQRIQSFLRRASAVRFKLVNENLRSCPQCVEDDIDLFGFGQWRILHQIPALLFCPEHGHSLSEEALGGPGGNIWQYTLPSGRHSESTHSEPWAASEGHATYLEHWTQLFEGRLPILRSHAWATYMDQVVAEIGDLASARLEIDNAIRRRWSTDSASIKAALGHQIEEDFIHVELSHNSAPIRLAQKLIVLGAASALGIDPPKANAVSQLRLDLSSVSENNGALPLHAQLRAVLLDSGLLGSLAPALLTDRNMNDVAKVSGVHRSRIWRAMEAIPDQLLDEMASAQEWSSLSWLESEIQRRKNRNPSRLKR